jgi:putative CocE/NonD family hydrolase
MITGWYDHGVQRELGTFGALLATGGEVTRAHTNVLIGPWGHSDIGKAAQGALRYDTAAGESDRMALRFFDYWLRDRKDNGWGDTPRLRWWQINEEGWHSAGEVSGPETHPETLYLHADGRIDAAAPTAAGATRTYVADPRAPVPTLGGANLGRQAGEEVVVGPQDQRPLESRPDVLVYTTEALTEPLRCHGSLRVGFTFALDRPDANFAIRLSDVWPDGRSMLVCDGIGRAKYRSGPEAGAPVTPGEAFLVTIGLPPVAITFPPGHRLRVSICGSNSPRFELNAHTGADRFSAADAVPVECTIYHDADRPATLALPVLN